MTRALLACIAAAWILPMGSALAQQCCPADVSVTTTCSATGFFMCEDGKPSTCTCGSGTGMPPTLGELAMPAASSFGPLLQGATSMAASLKVRNIGALAVTVTSITSDAPFEFVIVGHDCAKLSGGGACTVDVVFKPPFVGKRNTFIRVVSSGVGSPQTFLVLGVGVSAAAAVTPPPSTAPTIEVVEYFHDAWDHYFVTGTPSESAKLDAGAFSGWKRTGLTFKAYPNGYPGSQSMCRFFSTAFGERSSHFYTALASECADVKVNPKWAFEGDVFGVVLPDAAGACPAGFVALFRLYNQGQGGAPNHRYTTDAQVRALMIAFGWIAEGLGPLGIAGCVPV
ncbi:MAG: hypothetical protein IT518_15590 [Burkholderiales bacterium]|nr:hypothetical protein [Burkholderiales bacterium]